MHFFLSKNHSIHLKMFNTITLFEYFITLSVQTVYRSFLSADVVGFDSTILFRITNSEMITKSYCARQRITTSSYEVYKHFVFLSKQSFARYLHKYINIINNLYFRIRSYNNILHYVINRSFIYIILYFLNVKVSNRLSLTRNRFYLIIIHFKPFFVRVIIFKYYCCACKRIKYKRQ